MKTKPDRECLRYVLKVRGLFGRNRKVKFETWTLVADIDRSVPKTVNDLLPIFQAKLAEIKFKNGRAAIDEEPITQSFYAESDGREIVVECYALCSGKTIHEEIKS